MRTNITYKTNCTVDGNQLHVSCVACHHYLFVVVVIDDDVVVVVFVVVGE